MDEMYELQLLAESTCAFVLRDDLDDCARCWAGVDGHPLFFAGERLWAVESYSVPGAERAMRREGYSLFS